MTDNNITDELKRIKYLRMKPEERFLYDILTKVEFKYSNEYPDSIYLTLNDKILFEQESKNERFYVHYDEIWSVLSDKFMMKHTDIKIIISDMVWKTLNLKVHTPGCVFWQANTMVWKTLNLKVHTPKVCCSRLKLKMWKTLNLKDYIPV